MAPEGTQSLLPAASVRIKAFLWKDDCPITWQQIPKPFPREADHVCLEGCNSCLGCSHSQPPFTTPGNHKENTMAKQLCNFLTVLEFSLESSGLDPVGWDPPLGSGVQKAQSQGEWPEAHSGSSTGSQGQTWSRRSHPYPQGVSVLSLLVSWPSPQADPASVGCWARLDEPSWPRSSS